MTGAGVLGATLAAMITPFELGRVLVALAISLLAVAGSLGIVRGEPVIGALAGLGCLLLIDAVPELSVFLFFGAIGFVIIALAAAIEHTIRGRRAGDDAEEDGED